ncbi:GTPase [Flagellimonas myxillae]|uniref:GTPase n=1 Tax=Flagellimonas myxillae TaxID=2942214 RepID=UPI00201E9936|nr:GTPase [Muricauda myxillae]MCL6268066.1 GTPase [Muricauda myxillae]
MKTSPTHLLFVYNADSGIRNAILDSMHKVLSPSTYQCSLCDITFGKVSENKVWNKFRRERGLEMEFLHRDEFIQQYGPQFNFPSVYTRQDESLDILISSEELNRLNNAEELIGLIQERI